MSANNDGRYSRQVLFPPIGVAGQARIESAFVGLVGCGALGSFQAEALARAGIGRLRLIDRDTVDFSNLQRQWLYDEQDAADEVPKAIAAGRRIRRLNGQVTIEPVVADLTSRNAEELTTGCDLLLDGTDNFETRFLLNDVCVKSGIPWIYGAAVGSYGVVIPIDAARGPCLRCIYPDGPVGAHPTCDVAGILAAASAAVASRQIALALRFLVGWPDFTCYLETLDVWSGNSKRLSAGLRDPLCQTCGAREFDYLEGRMESPVSLCGRNAVQLHNGGKRMDLPSLAQQLRPFGEVRLNDFALRLHMKKYDVTVFPDGRAIVRGTTEIAEARSVYARLVGN